MSAEDRKTLEDNALAQTLKGAYEGLKHGPSRSTLFYVGVVIVGLFVVLLFRYFYYSSEQTASQRWVKLDGIVFQEQLDTFVQQAQEGELKDTLQGRLGQFVEARRLMGIGLRDLGNAPSEARKNIEAGLELYEKLLKSASRIPTLHQEALLATAKAHEALGNIDKALEQYSILAKDYSNTVMGKDAAKQKERLESKEGEREATKLAQMLSGKS